mmetsp:Transcript_49410/g.143240  ORF Transcript_49410/g.143240 Transcript_49410/m.143240 type:complete len:427 (-) Transcript_49410:244-1524(-)
MAGRVSIAAFVLPGLPSDTARLPRLVGLRHSIEPRVKGLGGSSERQPPAAGASRHTLGCGSALVATAIPAATMGMLCSQRRVVRTRRGNHWIMITSMQSHLQESVEVEDGVYVSLDEEIASLQKDAAELRASVAELEEEQATINRTKKQRWFKIFNAAGAGIDASSIRRGMKEFNGKDVDAARAEQLLHAHDRNQNGVIDLDEFDLDSFQATLEKLRAEEEANQRALLQEERQRHAQEKAEREIQEYYSTLPGPNTDTGVLTRLGSVLAYLLPLLDGLHFALPLAQVFPALQLFFLPFLPLLQLLNVIPLGQLLVFFAMQAIAGNEELPALARFNLRQAIVLDVALFLPNILSSLVPAAAAEHIPAEVVVALGGVIFLPLLACIWYSVFFCLWGQAPRGIAYVSEAAEMGMGMVPPGRSTGSTDDR